MEAGAGATQQLMIHELLTGRKFANELKHRLLPTSNLQDHEHLVAKILHSFKKSISIFTRHHRRRSSPHHYSNFKKKSRDSWTREHSTPNIDDGHSWRKYGQKTIRGYKHHRSYYRCRHKFEEGCKATKQVQQINEDHPAAAKYKTTFLGQHSCSRTNHNSTPTAANFYMMSSGSTDDDDDLQQQGDTSNFLSSSSVDTQAGAGFPVNSSAGAADTDNSYYQHDDDHHLLIHPSHHHHHHHHHHDLTAAIFDSVLTTNYDLQQVDEFDAADILGFPF